MNEPIIVPPPDPHPGAVHWKKGAPPLADLNDLRVVEVWWALVEVYADTDDHTVVGLRQIDFEPTRWAIVIPSRDYENAELAFESTTGALPILPQACEIIAHHPKCVCPPEVVETISDEITARTPAVPAAVRREAAARAAQLARYPESAKLSAVMKRSQACGEFIDWLAENHGIELSDGHGRPVRRPVRDLLAEFFEIDQAKVEAERRAMLDELSAQADRP